MASPKALPLDPVQSAVIAGLRYVSGPGPGYARKKTSRGFCYVGADGKPMREKNELQRILSLVIPPAWTNVWICPLANGHLQALGTDARGRRQYRYHALYRQVRNQTKFSRMLAFGKVLPAIRQRVSHDLGLPGLPREKVLATVVRLLETTFIRIGNVEYARQNSSFGLTTLRNRHVEIEGSTLRFSFRGKSGQEHEVEVRDRRLARIVKQCHDLPGHELFQYVGDNGERHAVDSNDVNAYLHQIAGGDFTAKDFRTWAGTIQTALGLADIGIPDSEAEAKKNIVTAIKETARRLGNKPSTCRKYYVHPAILDTYSDGTLQQMVKPPDEGMIGSPDELHPEEICVLALIRKRESAAFTSSKVCA